MIRSVENLPRRGAGVVRLVTAALALLSLAPVVDAQEGLAGTVRVEQATGGLTLNVNGKPMMVYGMNWDYSAQPGIGKVNHEARPQVVPVFIAGLINDLPRQILGNWTGGEQVRIWFGEPIDLSDFYVKRDSIRTHKEISDFLMDNIARLGEKDREWLNRERENSDE
jgi:hypothetical protein